MELHPLIRDIKNAALSGEDPTVSAENASKILNVYSDTINAIDDTTEHAPATPAVTRVRSLLDKMHERIVTELNVTTPSNVSETETSSAEEVEPLVSPSYGV